MGAAVLLVDVLAHLGHEAAAVTLAGALTQGPYARLVSLVCEPDDRRDVENAIVALRGQLDPDTYAHALATGASLSIDDLIAFMLTAIDDASAALPIKGESTERDYPSSLMDVGTGRGVGRVHPERP
jgi:hypothetical protein